MVLAPGDTHGAWVAMVTGGATRIGVETIQHLVDRGFAVVVGYLHDQRAAEAVVEQVLARHGAAVAIRADATDDVDVERLFGEAIEVFGKIDILVHWVGGLSAALGSSDLDAVELEGLWRNEAHGAFLVNREAARRLGPGGAIVNVAGTFGSAATGVDVHSRTTWLHALMHELDQDLHERGVTINAVWVDTDDLGAPGRIADVIVSLTCDDGEPVTGQVFRLDDR